MIARGVTSILGLKQGVGLDDLQRSLSALLLYETVWGEGQWMDQVGQTAQILLPLASSF